MRSVLLILVVLAAAGGIAWYLIDGNLDGEGDDPFGGDAVEDGEGDEGPGLTAAGTKRRRAPAETRGQCWIQGTVKRGGEAVAAEIELRHVESIDPRNPFGTRAESAMIARMLDSGVSTKDVLQSTTAGADGKYSFRGLAPGRYEVRATTEDGAMGFATASLPAHGARVEATIEIPTGDGTLVGRVVHADGRPYRGLVIVSSAFGMAAMFLGGGDVRPTYTDAEGRFKMGGLVPGKVSVSAIVPGVMRVMGPPATVPHEGEYLLTIDGGGVDTKGRVIRAADETPIEGATVFGGGGDPETSFSIRSTKSDADGRFSILLPVGRGGGMIVQAEGYAPKNVNLRGDAPEEVTVTMVALGKIVGRVVAKENGTPVTGVTLFAKGSDRAGGMPSASSAVTDADGRYTLDNVTPGSISVHALGAGWVSVGYSGSQTGDASPYAAQVEPGETAELDLEVIPGAKASGRVTTSGGEPVAGAVVEASGEGGRNDVFLVLLGLGSSFGATVTDEEGRYEIDVLAPGSNYKITARAPEHPDVESETFTATAGKTVTIDLVVAAPRWLSVRVVDAEGGGAIAGAAVVLQQGSGTGMDIRNFLGGGGIRTDAKGVARVGPLREGELKLSVTAAGYVTKSSVEVQDAVGEAPTFTVELTRGLVIAGRVTLPADVPVQTARVTVRRDGGTGQRWFHERPTVSADGSFRLDTIEEAGSYKVKGEAKWKERTFRAEMEVDAGTNDLVLELKVVEREAAGTIVFTVIDADGKSVPSGRVALRQQSDGGNATNYRSLSSGKVTFRDVKPGAELWVEVYDLVGNRGALLQGPYSAADAEVELRLPVSQVIAGRALRPDGRGAGGVRITAKAKHPETDSGHANDHGKGVSDGDGNFRVRGLGELEYELTFTVPKEFAPVPAQTVRAGGGDVVVQLRAGARATLTVLDFEGHPVPGAYAYARPEGKGREGWRGNRELPRADQDVLQPFQFKHHGMIRLRGLDPDATFHLTVSAPNGRKDLKGLNREGWRPADETLKLARAWSISGVVKDQNGKPAQGISVRARREGTEKWDKSSHSDEQGRFDLRELDAGRYELEARASGVTYSSPAAAAGPGSTQPVNKPDVKVVRAGTQNVALKVDTGERLVVRVRGMQAESGGWGTAMLRTADGSHSLSGGWDGPGRVTFQGLRAGVDYTLWIVGIPGNRYVHAKDVRAQSDLLEVDTKEGFRIHGRVTVPEGVALSRVGIGAGSREGYNAHTRVDAKTGTFEFEGLPAGSYHLSAHAWHDGKSYRGSAVVNTGGEAEIVLTPR